MPAGRPKSINTSKVFDVAKPDKSKPLGTSRPVIVNHEEGVQDASVINGVSAPLSPPSVSRKVIRPISVSSDESPVETVPAETSSIVILDEPKKSVKNSIVEAETAPEVIETSPEEVVEEAPAEEPTDASESATVPEIGAVETTKTDASEVTVEEPSAKEVEAPDASAEDPLTTEAPETEEVQPTKTKKQIKPVTEGFTGEEEKPATEMGDKSASASEGEPAGSDAAGVDALAESSTKLKEDQKAAEEQAKRDAALQELIDSKKYFVPLAHDSTQEKSHTGMWMGLLVVLLLVVGAYLAVDAKVIDAGINLPFHFFAQ